MIAEDLGEADATFGVAEAYYRVCVDKNNMDSVTPNNKTTTFLRINRGGLLADGLDVG